MTSKPQTPSKQPPSTQSRQQTLQQKRAASAWEHVHGVTQNLKEYTSLVRNAPATVLRDGLAPALAFWSKGKQVEPKLIDHLTMLIDHLTIWMRGELKFTQPTFLKYLLDCSSADYRQATTEALAYLVWLKRFAEALDDGKERKG